MLVVDHNEVFYQWHRGDAVQPLEYTGDVVVVFDPSKSNMAMVVGTPDGTFLSNIEFSGNNRKRGPAMDTTLYCEEVRQFLTVYLSRVNLYLVATEQAITKQGVNYHHSNMVLTEIRSNILNFFLETFSIKVQEINNWSWKFGVLPEGFRGKFEKGSKKWFTKCAPESPFSHYFEADMTDCICIYWYVLQQFCKGYTMYCNQVEMPECVFNYAYWPVTSVSDMKSVKYNPIFSIKENLTYYCNRIMGTFYMEVPVDDIDLKDIYGKTLLFDKNHLSDARVAVVAGRIRT